MEEEAARKRKAEGKAMLKAEEKALARNKVEEEALARKQWDSNSSHRGPLIRAAETSLSSLERGLRFLKCPNLALSLQKLRQTRLRQT